MFDGDASAPGTGFSFFFFLSTPCLLPQLSPCSPLSLGLSQSYQAETGTKTAVLRFPTAFIPAPVKSPLGPSAHLLQAASPGLVILAPFQCEESPGKIRMAFFFSGTFFGAGETFKLGCRRELQAPDVIRGTRSNSVESEFLLNTIMDALHAWAVWKLMSALCKTTDRFCVNRKSG